MAHDIFGGSKKSPPVDDRGVREEPMGIATNDSLLRPIPPRGTAFNRRTVVTLIMIFGIIFALGILFAFTPSRQKGDDALEAMGSLESQPGKGSGYINTPESINNIPNSYRNQAGWSNGQTPPDKLTPGIPLEMAQDVKIPVEYELEKYVPHKFELPEFNAEDPEQKELNEARKSAIRFGTSQRITQSNVTNKNNESPTYEEIQKSLLGNESPIMDSQKQKDAQDEKRDFLEKPRDLSFYAKSGLMRPVSKYEVKTSTVIPAVLITGINSDLPGYMSAQVRENVFDSVTGRHLLIPQGTRLVGVYDSKVNFGQKRVLVVWTRLIFPNGKSVDIENMPGVDLRGYSGLKDRVNNHWGRLISGAIITSLFSAAANLSADDDNDLTKTDKELAAEGFGEGMMDFGSKLSNKNLEIQPTLEIHPGFKFNLFVHKDFVLEPYQN